MPRRHMILGKNQMFHAKHRGKEHHGDSFQNIDGTEGSQTHLACAPRKLEPMTDPLKQCMHHHYWILIRLPRASHIQDASYSAVIPLQCPASKLGDYSALQQLGCSFPNRRPLRVDC